MQSVVNGFRNVCMAAVVAAFAGCSGGDAVNSLERMGLRGNVRSLDVSAYEAKACGGTVTKGSRVDDMQSCCSYRFDERGYVTGTEYLCGGHVVKWEEFVYDGSGRPERIVSRSVRYGGDRTVEFEWNGRCHVRRTFDEEGNEVSEEPVRERGGRRGWQRDVPNPLQAGIAGKAGADGGRRYGGAEIFLRWKRQSGQGGEVRERRGGRFCRDDLYRIRRRG